MSSSDHRPDGSVCSVTIGTRTTVALHGEIDLAMAPQLIEHLDAATAGHRPDVVVDLRAVTFIDCSSLGLLCRARRRSQERHGHLSLICTDARTLRLLRLADLLRIFPLTDPT
ncbi:STAS domain-containing protein [Streptomyces sp. H39-S7]|uniref:STAS domain-containing protein n=1 Tax=Streptomyces sp. H39-S7 TaxID=3004357 RepID=UPI0022AFA697|nr:STAS domain-containing protein [Streptomyces sp. H39-S7]MCZ4117807.1 STAS domain-containing protein [Streptomyces sp. H39-S7]